MRYLYGPVKSRRLGLSLGITLTYPKTCNFDCVYCQLGKSPAKENTPQEYVAIADILKELKEFLAAENGLKAVAGQKLNCISLSGFGEPTLNIDIAKLIKQIKQLTSIPLVLITNSSLLFNPKVRRDCLAVDTIVPSLDAVTQDVFKRIDRPLTTVKIKDIINGLIALRQEFKGRILLEIMLVKGINDSLVYTAKFKKVVEKINPDRIQLNIPLRSIAESWVKPPEKERLLQIKKILGPKCEII